MPVITKQTTKPQIRTSKSSSVLDRIVSVDKVDSGGIKISLYGRGKTGKTRLAASFPKPVLIIGAEDGTRSIKNVPDVKFVLVQDTSEVKTLIENAVRLGFRTVVMDTASSLQDMILCEILGIRELPAQKSWGMASRDQYGQCSLQIKTILRCALELPTNVVITAHERNFSEEGSSSELITPTIGSALTPSVAGWLNGAVEYICQTFIREKVETKTVKIGGKEQIQTKKTGGAEYCLRVGPHPTFMTGFRVPVGVALPDLIVDPTYEKIYKLVKGS